MLPPSHLGVLLLVFGHCQFGDFALEVTSLLQGEEECGYIVVRGLLRCPALGTLELVLQLTVDKETGGGVGALDADVGTLALLYVVVEGVEVTVTHERHAAVYGAAEVELGVLVREEQCAALLLGSIEMER